MFEVLNFLPANAYSDLRAYADTATYNDERNEVDGVVYPSICKMIPSNIAKVIMMKLSHFMGRPIKDVTMFIRASLEGSQAPHQAHTDNSMGCYSFMLYLTPEEFCKGGTSFLEHKATGIRTAYEEDLNIAFADTNEPDAWKQINHCAMAPNKGCLFHSTNFHRAEPIGGFGSDVQTGRLVLTCFFS